MENEKKDYSTAVKILSSIAFATTKHKKKGAGRAVQFKINDVEHTGVFYLSDKPVNGKQMVYTDDNNFLIAPNNLKIIGCID